MGYGYNYKFKTYRSGNYNSKIDLSSAKLNIPTFFGRDDPKRFLNCLDEVKAIFKTRELPKWKKFGTVLLAFHGVAMG